MNKIYRFNFKNLLIDYLHRLENTPNRVSWLYACLANIRSIHNELLVFITQQEQRLSISPQIIVIEKYLQKNYHQAIYLEEDMPNRSITIHIPTRVRFPAKNITQFVKTNAHIGTAVTIQEFYLNN